MQVRTGGRTVDLGGLSVYQGGPKFDIKHKSCCLHKSKLVDWVGGKQVDWGGQASLYPLVAGPDAGCKLIPIKAKKDKEVGKLGKKLHKNTLT